MATITPIANCLQQWGFCIKRDTYFSAFYISALSTLACIFIEAGKEPHAGKMLKTRKHEKFPTGSV